MVDRDSDGRPRLLRDPYLEWVETEGVPVAEGYGIDLLAIETTPWPRFESRGAIAHLLGRGDFVTMFLLDLEPGGKIPPQRHLYEQLVYVLSGHGSTEITLSDGRKHQFEWGPRSLFCLPLNLAYRIFNGSGRERARIAFCNYFPLVKNLFHRDDFIFQNPCSFPEREGGEGYFAGEGDYIPIKPGWHMWETNFVPDVGAFELKQWDARGAGGSHINFLFPDAVMKAHCSAMPVGTYKKAHRHGPDFLIFPIAGSGYSLFWHEGEEMVKVDWRHGMVFAPPAMMYHQHFNTSPEPTRYLAVTLGSLQYPFVEERRKQMLAVDKDVKDGGRQIEYEDQDPRIHALYLAELARHGASSRMGKFIDESKFDVAKAG
jgi:hypothetical protein